MNAAAWDGVRPACLAQCFQLSSQRCPAVPAELESCGILFATRATEQDAGAVAGGVVIAQYDGCTSAVGVVVEPDLRPGDLRRNVADDARHVLVEDVRLDAVDREDVLQQICL